MASSCFVCLGPLDAGAQGPPQQVGKNAFKHSQCKIKCFGCGNFVQHGERFVIKRMLSFHANCYSQKKQSSKTTTRSAQMQPNSHEADSVGIGGSKQQQHQQVQQEHQQEQQPVENGLLVATESDVGGASCLVCSRPFSVGELLKPLSAKVKKHATCKLHCSTCHLPILMGQTFTLKHDTACHRECKPDKESVTTSTSRSVAFNDGKRSEGTVGGGSSVENCGRGSTSREQDSFRKSVSADLLPQLKNARLDDVDRSLYSAYPPAFSRAKSVPDAENQVYGSMPFQASSSTSADSNEYGSMAYVTSGQDGKMSEAHSARPTPQHYRVPSNSVPDAENQEYGPMPFQASSSTSADSNEYGSVACVTSWQDGKMSEAQEAKRTPHDYRRVPSQTGLKSATLPFAAPAAPPVRRAPPTQALASSATTTILPSTAPPAPPVRRTPSTQALVPSPTATLPSAAPAAPPVRRAPPIVRSLTKRPARMQSTAVAVFQQQAVPNANVAPAPPQVQGRTDVNESAAALPTSPGPSSPEWGPPMAGAISPELLNDPNDRFLIDMTKLTKLESVGSGSFGEVFRGKWRRIEVAVKVMMLAEAADDFMKEVRITANLRPHPNVAQVYGYCTFPRLALVSEFVSRGSIEAMLIRKEVPLEQGLSFMLDIARGMLHLSEEGIIHKDLAARNVLVDSHFTAKIADFGLARDISGKQQHTTKSETGPLKWMAPESINDKVFSVQSDCWMFGVTCLEIATQDHPFPELDALKVCVQVATHRLRPTFPPSLDGAILQILQQCNEFEPAARPSFEQVVDAFEGALGVV